MVMLSGDGVCVLQTKQYVEWSSLMLAPSLLPQCSQLTCVFINPIEVPLMCVDEERREYIQLMLQTQHRLHRLWRTLTSLPQYRLWRCYVIDGIHRHTATPPRSISETTASMISSVWFTQRVISIDRRYSLLWAAPTRLYHVVRSTPLGLCRIPWLTRSICNVPPWYVHNAKKPLLCLHSIRPYCAGLTSDRDITKASTHCNRVGCPMSIVIRPDCQKSIGLLQIFPLVKLRSKLLRLFQTKPQDDVVVQDGTDGEIGGGTYHQQ